MGRKPHLLLLLLAFLPIIFSLNSSYDSVLPATLEIQNSSNLEISAFSAGSASLEAGDSLAFSITIFNVGNSIDDYSAAVGIYDSAGALAGTLSFANSTIIGGETQALSGSWSSAGLPAGDYLAMANITYGVFTKSRNLSFTITAPAAPPAGPGPSPSATGGSRGAPFRKISEIPSISLLPIGQETQNLHVIQYQVFKELMAGDSSFEFTIIENLGTESVLADLSPLGPAAFLSSGTRNNLLFPGQPNAVPVPFNVPQDATPGYYLLQFNITSGNSAFSQSMVVRVLPASKDPAQPAIKRSIELTRGDQPKTRVVLTVENNGEKSIEFLQVYDRLPAGLLQKPGGVQYSISPGVISPDERLVRWDFQNLAPHEKRMVAYEIPQLLSDMNSYSEWRVEEVVVSDTGVSGLLGPNILLRDLRLPTLMAGAEGRVRLQLFNAGAASQSMEISLVSPPGWVVTPQTLSAELPARSSTWMEFAVRSPPSAPDGEHPFRLRLDYGGDFDEHALSLLTLSAMVASPSAPLSSQLALWIGKNAILLEAALGGAALFLLGAYFAHRRLNAPRYDKERAESVKQLEKMFKQPE